MSATSRVVMMGALGAVLATFVSIGAQRCRADKAPPDDPKVAVTPSPAPPPPPSRPSGKVSAGPPRMLHLDARRTNRSPFAGPTTPRLAWTFDTGGPIQAAPALLDDGTIVVASLSGKVYGLDQAGEPRFSRDLEERIYSSPLVTGDGIFLGSDVRRFYGLHPDGRIRWKLETTGDADTGATVTPSGGIVFASGRMVYGVEPNGTVRFRVKTARKTFASPAVGDDGTAFVGSQDDHVYAIAEDGTVRWRRDVGADADGSPAIADDGTVYVGTDGNEVIALRPEDGSIVWRRNVGGYVRGSLSVGRYGTIFVGTYGPNPRMVALDPEGGEIRWSFAIRGTGALEFGIHGGPVEDAAGRLYFGAQDDFVYALGQDGELLWKLPTGGDVDASLVITEDGTLLAGSADGKLYAIEDASSAEP